MNKSIATINAPEFINLQPLEISPLISACDIKVLYLNGNRNRSFITKEVATEMAKTLRGSPIVAAYSEDKGDFLDHGDVITLDSEGVHFNCITKPYGFVAPDAKVWFQDFEDIDESGVSTIRTYLMTTGYLWTGAYPEAQLAITEGRAQSMELDEESLKGHWTEKENFNIQFYIIDDAIFQKLCILGEDVEPCFEGASVTAPEVSKNFTLDKNFTKSLYDMMNELKFALKGGQTNMENNTVGINAGITAAAPITATEPVSAATVNTGVTATEGTPVDASATNAAANGGTPATEKSQDNVVKESVPEIQGNIEGKTFEKVDESNKSDNNAQTEEVNKQEYALLQGKYAELQTKFKELEDNFVAFKNQVETQKKEKLLSEFTLDADTMKQFKDNLAKYSYEKLETELSVLESRARRAAAVKTESTEKVEPTPAPATTFAVNSCSCDDEITAALKAARKNN